MLNEKVKAEVFQSPISGSQTQYILIDTRITED